jgi:hypothetical protein
MASAELPRLGCAASSGVQGLSGAHVHEQLKGNRSFRAVVLAVAVTLGSSVGLGAVAATGAGAAVSGSTHELPAIGVAGVSFLCGPDNGYGCTPGYRGNNVPAAAWGAYGCPYASGCPSVPHNCPLYVDYRLNQAGVMPTWSVDANLWAGQAQSQGYRVDQSPAVGAVAQWNLFKGHLAYVEAYDPTGVTVSMDWWSSAAATPTHPDGYTSRVRIARTSPAYPDNFLHFKDVGGGYTLDGYGGIHPFGVGSGRVAPAVHGGGYWSGWDIARGLATLPNASGGYTLDGFGGLHPFRIGNGAAPPVARGLAYWKGWDIARGIALMPNGQGGYMVDGFGGIHPFRLGNGSTAPAVSGGPYWQGQDIAQGITILPSGKGGYVIDRLGVLHPFAIGSNPKPPAAWAFDPARSARGAAVLVNGTGGYAVDANGSLHGFATHDVPYATKGVAVWPGWDIARDVAVIRAS